MALTWRLYANHGIMLWSHLCVKSPRMSHVLKTNLCYKEVTLWSFANFQETFFDQPIWICKWVSWWYHRLTNFNFVHKNDKNFIFQPWECYTCPYSSLNRCRIMLTDISWYEGHTITSLGKILKLSKLYVYKLYGK